MPPNQVGLAVEVQTGVFKRVGLARLDRAVQGELEPLMLAQRVAVEAVAVKAQLVETAAARQAGMAGLVRRTHGMGQERLLAAGVGLGQQEERVLVEEETGFQTPRVDLAQRTRVAAVGRVKTQTPLVLAALVLLQSGMQEGNVAQVARSPHLVATPSTPSTHLEPLPHKDTQCHITQKSTTELSSK